MIFDEESASDAQTNPSSSETRDSSNKNLLTARSVSGHFVPPMGSRKNPPKAGLARLGWTRTPKNEL